MREDRIGGCEGEQICAVLRISAPHRILRTDPASAETDRLLRMTYGLDQEGNARYESGDPDLYYAHCDKCDRYVVGDSASGTGLRFVAHPRSAAFPCYRGDVGTGIEYYWPLPPALPR